MPRQDAFPLAIPVAAGFLVTGGLYAAVSPGEGWMQFATHVLRQDFDRMQEARGKWGAFVAEAAANPRALFLKRVKKYLLSEEARNSLFEGGDGAGQQAMYEKQVEKMEKNFFRERMTSGIKNLIDCTKYVHDVIERTVPTDTTTEKKMTYDQFKKRIEESL